LKRSVWQDKIFSVKVLIETLTGQRIIDTNILSLAVRDLPSGGRHGDNPPSGRTPPRDASSSSDQSFEA
jgi:hypothetical protein